MLTVADTIESSGHPLAFKVRQGTGRSSLVTGLPGRDTIRVEARALGGHQKEAIVTEGRAGSTWRVVSDEGPGLKGSDLAPFPLGFFNAGMHADLLGRLLNAAGRAAVSIEAAELALQNAYRFEGSFYQGTGKGTGFPPTGMLHVRGGLDQAVADRLLAAAMAASPLMASMRTALRNTFALYVNGKRVPVTSEPSSMSPDEVDPLKAHAQAPAPLAGGSAPADLITRYPRPEGDAPSQVIAGDAKLEIPIEGASRLLDPAGLVEARTWLPFVAFGNRFRLVADERAKADDAPSGLVLACAGIAFCYMTQLIRYSEYRKYDVRAIRVVQTNPFELVEAAAGPQAIAHPVDTHLFVHGREADDVMQALLSMSARTCYLHAALGAPIEPDVRIEVGTPAR